MGVFTCHGGASCVIIHGIWNDARKFCVGTGTAGYYSAIMGSWIVYVGVSGVVCSSYWIGSLVFSCSSTSGKLSNYMGWRRGKGRLGYLLFVVLLFLFSCGWAYHASADVSLGECTPSEMGWLPSEISSPPS